MHIGSIQFRLLGLLATWAICSMIACSGGGGAAASGTAGSVQNPSSPIVLHAPVINAPSSAVLGATDLAASVASTEPGATYAWSIVGGTMTSAATGTAVIFSADQAGTLSLTCSATLGSQTQSATVQIQVQAAPPAVPQISTVTTTSAGSTGLKASVSQPEPGTTYGWTAQNGTITTGVNSPDMTFTALSQGALILTCTATNAVGSRSSQATIQVGPAALVGTVYNVPSSIDSTGATDVTTALNNWIATVPNGTASNPSIIRFPSGSVFLLSQGVQFSNRSYLTFDGYGAKLKLNPAAGFTQLQSLFLLGKTYNSFFGGLNTHIIIRGFELEASNPTPGVWSASREMAHAVEIDDSNGVEVYDIVAHGIGGDGFKTTGGSNLYIHNNHIIDAGRQGVSVISGDHILIENNQFDDVGYFVLDVEPNLDTESATDIIFRNNTAGSWGPNLGKGAGFVACGCGTAYNQIGNITITGNTITGRTNASLLSFFNQNQYKRLYNIVFTNNKATQSESGTVLMFKNVDGLTVTGNIQPLSQGTLMTTTNNTAVLVSPNP